MKNENYIQLQGWMINELGLKGNELILYAIIFGFSQDGESEYYGSQRYIASAMKISLPTANKIINGLLEKNLIIKTEESRYKFNSEVLKKVKQGVKETLTVSVKESLTNNIYTNNNILANENSQEEFNSKSYIEKMLENKNKHIQLIAKYFISKGLVFPSQFAVRKEIERWVKDARVIVEYPQEQVNKTFAYVLKEFPDVWNLSTIRKFISKQ